MATGSDWNQLHFVLVNGAGHGGWCWYMLTTLLEAEGHKVTTVDLTACGINTTPFFDVSTFTQYNEPLVSLMNSLPDTEKVVLVGHSIGGLNITDVLYKFPEKILVAVYLAANMMKEGYGFSMIPKQGLQDSDSMIPKQGLQDSDIDIWSLLKTLFGVLIDISHWEIVTVNWKLGVMVKPEYLRSTYYNMSPVEASTLASSLVRPTPVLPLLNVPLNPTSGGLNVPRVYIRTLKDQLMDQDSQEKMISQWPPSKVYALGSDHSAFFSTPVELARILIEAATSVQKVD